MSEEGLEVGRRGSHPTCQGLMLEETSCPDRAVLAKGSWSSWEPLVASLQLISSPRCCPASAVGDQRLSSPTPGCLGSVLSFCSLNLFIVSCNQSPSRREPSALKSL